MKRTWRFIKWCFDSMGLAEWYLLSGSFCLGAGLAAMAQGNQDSKQFWFGAAAVIAIIAMLSFILQGTKSMWNRFKEDDERAFNILKDKDLK